MVTYIRGKRAKARFPLQEKKELSAFQYRKADQWDAEGADTEKTLDNVEQSLHFEMQVSMKGA